MNAPLELLPMQQQVLAVPTDVGAIGLFGSKGSGKTTAAWLKLAQRVQTLRAAFSGVVARVSFPSLIAPFETSIDVFTRLGMRPDVNKRDFIIRFPSYGGAALRFMPLDDRQAVLERTSGMSLTDVLIDEAQTFANFDLPALLIGCLRAPPHIPTLVMLTANPGGVGAANLLRNFVEPAERLPPGMPFDCDMLARRTVVLMSNYRDNVFIDRAQYRRSLVAMSGGSSQYLEQIDGGNFFASIGNYFALSSQSFVSWPDFVDWRDFPHLKIVAGMDWGSRNPFSIAIAAKVVDRGPLPGGRTVARGSFVFFDCLTSADESQGWARAAYHANVPQVAGDYLRRCEVLGVRPPTIAGDNQLFQDIGSAEGSLGSQFSQFGVRVVAAPKPRLAVSLPRLREMIYASQSDDVLPCVLFAAGRVPYLVNCVQLAPSAAGNPDLVDDRFPGLHGLDAIRYTLEAHTKQGAAVHTGPMFPTSREQAHLDHVEREARQYLRARQRFARQDAAPTPGAPPTFFRDLIRKSEARRAPAEPPPAAATKSKATLKSGKIERTI